MDWTTLLLDSISYETGCANKKYLDVGLLKFGSVVTAIKGWPWVFRVPCPQCVELVSWGSSDSSAPSVMKREVHSKNFLCVRMKPCCRPTRHFCHILDMVDIPCVVGLRVEWVVFHTEQPYLIEITSDRKTIIIQTLVDIFRKTNQVILTLGLKQLSAFVAKDKIWVSKPTLDRFSIHKGLSDEIGDVINKGNFFWYFRIKYVKIWNVCKNSVNQYF